MATSSNSNSNYRAQVTSLMASLSAAARIINDSPVLSIESKRKAVDSLTSVLAIYSSEYMKLIKALSK